MSGRPWHRHGGTGPRGGYAEPIDETRSRKIEIPNRPAAPPRRGLEPFCIYDSQPYYIDISVDASTLTVKGLHLASRAAMGGSTHTHYEKRGRLHTRCLHALKK